MRVLLIAAILAALSVPARSECLFICERCLGRASWITSELEAAAARPRRRKMLVRQKFNQPLGGAGSREAGSRFPAQNGV